jgi:hypothetical protein
MTSLDMKLDPDVELAAAAFSDQVGACARAPWRMLAVVPAEDTGSSKWLAEAVARACGGPLTARSFCADGLSGEGVLRQVEEVDAILQGGGRVVVALGAMMGRRAGAPLMALADGVVLCVQLGVSTTRSARRAIDLIGRERFIGAVTLEAIRPGARG